MQEKNKCFSSASLRLGFICVFCLVLSACVTKPGHREIISEGGFWIKISAPKKSLKKEIRFSADKSELAHLPPHVSLKLLVSDELGDHELVVNNRGSSIVYDYELNGKQIPFGEKQKEWFALQIPLVLEKTSLAQ